MRLPECKVLKQTQDILIGDFLCLNNKEAVWVTSVVEQHRLTVRHRQDLYNNEMENAGFMFSSAILVTWTSLYSSSFISLSLSLSFFLLMPSPENIPTCQVLFLQTAEAANCNPISKCRPAPYLSCTIPVYPLWLMKSLTLQRKGVVCRPSFHQDTCNAMLTARN